MATYANPLYANGVPNYGNELSALSGVFQALAPNPLRDLQIQGYANNARLSKLRADVIQNQQDSLPALASAFQNGGNLQDAIPNAILGGNLKNLKQVIDAVPASYGFRALGPGGNANVDQSALATAVGAAGGNVGNTMYGFTANQDRQTAEANMKNDTTMRGQDIRSADSRYGTDVGASTARRGQDISAENSTYSTNMQFLKPSARAATGAGGTGAGGSAGTGSTELNPKGVEQLDSALANVLVGRSVPDADRADLAARTQAYYLAQPNKARNYQLAANRAVADLQAGATLDDSTEDNWLSADALRTKPAAQRAPLPEPWQPPARPAAAAGGLSPVAQAVLQGNPNLRRPLSAEQISAAAPAPAPVAAPAPAPAPVAAPPGGDVLSDAANAISSGAPREAVIQRLRGMGVSDQQIQAAGL